MRRVWLASILTLTGCYHSDSIRNAPGNIDLSRPSAQDVDPSKAPTDPGEQSLLLAAGPGGGLMLPSQSGDPAAQGTIGAEVSLYYGRVKHSHRHDSREHAFNVGVGWLDWYTGLNVGALALARSDRWLLRSYMEAQYSPLRGILGFGAGALVDSDGKAGPQFTMNLGPLYARGSTRLGVGTDFELGVLFKVPVQFWVSSQ